MKLTRRQFLNMLALMPLAGISIPEQLKPLKQLALQGISADDGIGRAGRNLLEDSELLQHYLDRFDERHDAPLNEMLLELKEAFQQLGFIFYDIKDYVMLSSINAESALPIASAFKGPLLMYFLEVVDPSVWNAVPVEYWNATDPNEVPAEYRDAFQQHQSILNELYIMIVMSDNRATGIVFGYIADVLETHEPMAAFNDWSHQTVGISQLSGMSTWTYGMPGRVEASDPRYVGRGVNINYRVFTFDNIMTPRDLGMYYAWFLTQANPLQREVGLTLLSTIQDERRANLERVAFENGGMSYTKNGSFINPDSQGGNVISDAGILDFPEEDKAYLVVFLSMGLDNKMEDFFVKIDHAVNGLYDAQIRAFEADRAQQADIIQPYIEHLKQMYPYHDQVTRDHFNYAYVLDNNIPLFSTPSEEWAVRNPVISSSIFGVHLMMQGALVRFEPVDNEWVELKPDSPSDSVRYRLADRLYTRMENLWVISPEHVAPIDFLVSSTAKLDQKYMVVNVQTRELSVCEGEEVAFKTPMILNEYATPRGSYIITTKWFARSMQTWAPGVPFTCFFHEEGYAIHGSPWQYWESTVNTDNYKKRTSGGCVNMPNWTISVGDYTRPVDELVFRWAGGLADPEASIYEYATQIHPPVRVYGIDHYEELSGFYFPGGVDRNKARANIEAAPLTAPESFFRTSA